MFGVAVVAGGMTFSATTIALPKVLDECLGLDLPLALTGTQATTMFVFGALTQLLTGRLVDRFALPTIFVGIAALQPLGLRIASAASGVVLLVGLVLIAAATCGQAAVNDAMVKRYVPARHRSKAFSVRYFLGFTVSGFAVPLIALLHEAGGPRLVLAVAGGFGVVVFLVALAFYTLAGRQPTEVTGPAE